MDDELEVIQRLCFDLPEDLRLGKPSESVRLLADGKALFRCLLNFDASNLWALFPLDDNFHGVFVFVSHCVRVGICLENIPDPFELTRGRDALKAVLCLQSLFVRSSSMLTPSHSGPKADDSIECSCLMCRWKSALRVLLPATHQGTLRMPNSVRRLVEEGVPSFVREHVWLLLSGGLALQRTRKPQYLTYFPQALSETNTYLDLIDLDLSRTFADEPSWRERGFDQVTRRLLAAYSLRNTSVGYCQGLSYIAGTLATVMSEEVAFAILCAVLEDGLMPPDYYTSLTGAVVDRQVLEILVPKFLPNLVTLLDANLADYTFMTIPWHMCLFSTTLNNRATLIRLWDFLFAFGPCVLFRTSLGILAELETVLAAGTISIAQVRDTLRVIEEKTGPSDLAVYFKTFSSCTNELISDLREECRQLSRESSPPCFLSVRIVGDSGITDNSHFGAEIPTPLTSPQRKRREAQKSVVAGLGDFMGQP